MGFDLHPQGLLELYSPGSQVPLLQQWSWDGNLLVPSLWILEEYVCLPWSKILLPTENDMSQLPRDGVVRAEDPGSSHLPSTEASAKPIMQVLTAGLTHQSPLDSHLHREP